MGYDVHITRRNTWFDETGEAVLLDEWLECVHGDPELRLDGCADAHLKNGSVLRSLDPSMAVWVAHPEHGTREGMAWIWLSGGNVVAKNPDAHTLQKMWRIAQGLGAIVQGDECELYDLRGQSSLVEFRDQGAAPPKKAWWRFW